ncbi:hypothetical protein ACMDMY_005601, partial [Salmonella enterica]
GAILLSYRTELPEKIKENISLTDGTNPNKKNKRGIHNEKINGLVLLRPRTFIFMFHLCHDAG